MHVLTAAPRPHRYEESEAALERTRRAATEVSLELEAAGWPLIAPLIRWIAPLIR